MQLKERKPGRILDRLFLFLEAQSGTRKNATEKSGTNPVSLYIIKTYENNASQSGTNHYVPL
jgi:hypothetical protein